MLSFKKLVKKLESTELESTELGNTKKLDLIDQNGFTIKL